MNEGIHRFDRFQVHLVPRGPSQGQVAVVRRLPGGACRAIGPTSGSDGPEACKRQRIASGYCRPISAAGPSCASLRIGQARSDKKEPGGAFEPFGLPDPPGRFVVWPMAQHEPPTLERRPWTTPLHARAIRKSPGSRMFRSHPTGAQCWQRGSLCCCSGCPACSCCVWRNGCCSACCSRNRHEGHGHLAVGPTNIVPHNKSFRNRQVSACPAWPSHAQSVA